MARVKRGVTSRAKHKKVLKAVKGQWGRRKNTIRVARQAMEKAMQYAYSCLLYTSPSPRDRTRSRMPSSA